MIVMFGHSVTLSGPRLHTNPFNDRSEYSGYFIDIDGNGVRQMTRGSGRAKSWFQHFEMFHHIW